MNNKNNNSLLTAADTTSIEDFAQWDEASVEAYMIEAAWTLRRLPDREMGLQWVRSAWVAAAPESDLAYGYESQIKSAFEVAVNIPPASHHIDRMQTILDWLRYIPHYRDRKLVFCAALSRSGEMRPWRGGRPTENIQWRRVRELIATMTTSVESRRANRLSEHYRGGLNIIARVLTSKQVRP